MRKFYLLAFFVAFLCFSCKKEEANEKTISTISSSLVKYENDSIADFSELSVSNYELEALQILEKGKKRLQVAIPITIEEQVDLYEETIRKFSEQAISSMSLNETTDKIIDVEAEIVLEMMEDELRLNKVYYDIVYNLEELNKKYADLLDPQGGRILLEDYHNSPSIVYSFDIMEKITEFVNSEAAFQNGKNRSTLLSVLTYIGHGIRYIPLPHAQALGYGLTGLAMSGDVVNDRVMENQAGVPIPTIISRMNSALQNPEEREKLKTDLKSKLHLANEDHIENPTNKYLSASEYESARREFSGFGNRVKGRIGDFSDGIITQPIGHLRNLIGKNVKVLANSVFEEQTLIQ